MPADHPTVVSRLVRFCSLVAVVLAVPASAALAAESPMPTRQQVAMNAEWAWHLAPEDIPPVDRRGIVCLVDSGVDVTPDLPADRPEGPIVLRDVAVALEQGGDFEDGQGGRSYAAQHGTRMASYATATAGNDWGTVGILPWVRIISVRAMLKDSTAFPSAAYQDGIRTCQRLHNGDWPALTTISLSFGCGCTLSARERSLLEDARASAHAAGLSVFAAAGNSGVDRLDAPSDVTGFVPITAEDGSGTRCPYANDAPETIGGPGCGIDSADPLGTPFETDAGGSSSATAMVAAAAAFLRSLAPATSRADVETALRQAAGRRLVDVAAAARLLGLGPVVDRASARAREASSSTGGAETGGESGSVPQESGPSGAVAVAVERTTLPKPLPSPRARVDRRRGRPDLVRVTNRPRGAEIEILLEGRRFTRTSSRITVPRRSWTRMRMRYVDDRGSERGPSFVGPFPERDEAARPHAAGAHPARSRAGRGGDVRRLDLRDDQRESHVDLRDERCGNRGRRRRLRNGAGPSGLRAHRDRSRCEPGRCRVVDLHGAVRDRHRRT